MRAPITDKHLLEIMWERFPEIMKRGAEQPAPMIRGDIRDGLVDDEPSQPQQEPVAHSIVAGALFDFMGWLTSRNECLVLSSTDDAAPAADAIKDFAHMRNLSIDDAKVREWQEHLASPPASKPLTDDQIMDMYNEPRSDAEMLEFARAIEAAHGIKGDA